jgi:hypothetical protein
MTLDQSRPSNRSDNQRYPLKVSFPMAKMGAGPVASTAPRVTAVPRKRGFCCV